ncbi:ThiF family adenylyltransferase [Pelagibius sp. Alg239-R121]|uniref:ThiF family adenylyltransferase n=1 Tax=Pelagibius sp. Alg239-R121 TaxID=2993448 RepID=UPI0024A78409|nr:ThiF family adenylyltransferase [Pelagibius sp. Alg239-R121]
MWWLTDQTRLRIEREAIEELEADWFQNPVWSVDNQLRLKLAFDIVIARGRYVLQLIYHNTFPTSPPSIVPVDGAARLSGHQYGAGGELCLEIRNDNWTPDVTGAMMIESARRLLETETPGDDGAVVHAPSAHDLPVTLSLSDVTRFYVGPSARLVLAADDIDGLPMEIGIDFYSGRTFVAHVLSIGSKGEDKKQRLTPEALRKTCVVKEGVVFVTDTPTKTLEKIKTFEALNDLLGDRFSLTQNAHWAVVLRGSEGGLTLLCHFADDDDLMSFTTVLAPFDGNRSGVPSADIREKKVGIVGLGSLGSKIAVSLARSGVRRFELVDGDILNTGNLERHDGDWRDVGRHKVELTAHRLRLIRCDVEIGVWKSAIGAQVSSQQAANVSQALTFCDLIIDVTANPDVFNHLAGLSLRHNRSLIWGAVYAGGVGGEIARARINKDPSPYDIRTVINQYYETSDGPPPISTGGGYDGSIGEAAPMQATDADVSVFASHFSAFTLDTLIDIEPSNYDAHAYLVGLKRGWLFNGPFDARPIIADAPIRSTISSGSETTIESDFIKSLFQGANDETANTESDD